MWEAGAKDLTSWSARTKNSRSQVSNFLQRESILFCPLCLVIKKKKSTLFHLWAPSLSFPSLDWGNLICFRFLKKSFFIPEPQQTVHNSFSHNVLYHLQRVKLEEFPFKVCQSFTVWHKLSYCTHGDSDSFTFCFSGSVSLMSITYVSYSWQKKYASIPLHVILPPEKMLLTNLHRLVRVKALLLPPESNSSNSFALSHSEDFLFDVTEQPAGLICVIQPSKKHSRNKQKQKHSHHTSAELSVTPVAVRVSQSQQKLGRATR